MDACHSMYIGPPCFPVFNDRELSEDPILRSDSPGMQLAASASWSADCEWYFMILPEGIFADAYETIIRNKYDDGYELISRQHGRILGHAGIQLRELKAAYDALSTTQEQKTKGEVRC
jgi:hypothetical protein